MKPAGKFMGPVLSAILFFMLTTGPSSFATTATNTYWRPIALNATAYRSPYRIALFNPDYGADGARAWSQTKSVFVYGFGVIAVLVAMPTEMTGWERDPDILNKWVENVTTPPEWDRNNWIYNYVGHTYFGGVYYQVARKSGYRQWDAFIYSLLMSTFYWEYGIEAFAEVPSFQDLVTTPVLGWLYGEWAYRTEFSIRSHENEVLGSPLLGGVALFLLDPVDVLGSGINRLTGRTLIKSGYGYFSYQPVTVNGSTEYEYYLNLRIPIGACGPKTKPAPKFMNNPSDPVTVGIIGLSGGSGYAILDEDWGVENVRYNKLTLGLYFTSRTSLRLAYARGTSNEKSSGAEIVYENYSLDAQLYLNTHRKLRPYLSVGLGNQLWNEENDNPAFQWNGGVGVHWQFWRKLAVNTEWLNHYSPSKHTYDQQLNLGLIYRFGEGEHPW